LLPVLAHKVYPLPHFLILSEAQRKRELVRKLLSLQTSAPGSGFFGPVKCERLLMDHSKPVESFRVFVSPAPPRSGAATLSSFAHIRGLLNVVRRTSHQRLPFFPLDDTMVKGRPPSRVRVRISPSTSSTFSLARSNIWLDARSEPLLRVCPRSLCFGHSPAMGLSHKHRSPSLLLSFILLRSLRSSLDLSPKSAITSLAD